MNNLINLARHIPAPEATLTVAYTPIRLPMDGRPPLELRLTAPAAGGDLPIVLLSHGFGPSNYIPSKDGYAPLAQFWAERGFAVIQPTHASSRVGGLPADAPGAPFFWRAWKNCGRSSTGWSRWSIRHPLLRAGSIIPGSQRAVTPLVVIPSGCCWARA